MDAIKPESLLFLPEHLEARLVDIMVNIIRREGTVLDSEFILEDILDADIVGDL